MLTIALVEDDPIAADLLKEYLSDSNSNKNDFKIVSHFLSSEEALEQLPKLPLPNVVLMDINLPKRDGIETTAILKKAYPNLEIIMLTAHEDSDSILAAIKAGASGYLLKASSRQQIRDAIIEVNRGGSFLSGRVARKMLNLFQTVEVEQDVSSHQNMDKLTKREQQILEGLINGSSYKIISTDLKISVYTVNNHIRKIYEKLQVNSRAEAVAKMTGRLD